MSINPATQETDMVGSQLKASPGNEKLYKYNQNSVESLYSRLDQMENEISKLAEDKKNKKV
jgi:hypothetical protein